jgi:flagellar motor component MotA
MTEQLHRLIDGNASQAVINERVAGLMEQTRARLETIGSDHETRLRYLERTISWSLGAVGAIGAIVGLTVTLVKLFK